jgi:hypothetical protein
MTDSKGNIYWEFMKIEYDKLITNTLDAPLTHALIVVKCNASTFSCITDFEEGEQALRLLRRTAA